ncbi:MAG: ATPase, T2SS/T4P/T4SS family [bacterium]|nr:ATPase, T2SS/T4P/T4SS family [bacterium]
MNQKQFTKLLAKRTDLSVKEARKIVEAFGDSIETALKKGERVVYSNFGSFYLVNYPSKTINHPAFGNKRKTIMLATNAVKWMPSDNIKDLVDHHLETSSATSFGSTKIIQAAKKNAGISDRKALDITKAEYETMRNAKENSSTVQKTGKSDDETVKIPIRIIKKSWVDLPVRQIPLSEKEIVPFDKNSLQVKYIDLSKTDVPDHILCLVPEEIARRTKIIPIDLKDEILILGMTDPKDHDTLAAIRKIVRKKISPRLVSESDFDKVFAQYDRLALTGNKPETTLANTVSDSEPIKIDSSTPVSRVVSLILKRAIREQATTIHFDPTEQSVLIKFRINSRIIEKTALDKSLQKAIVAKIKQLANLNKKSSDDNHQNIFCVNIDGTDEEFEFLSIPVVNGEKIVINIKDRPKVLEKLTELDLRDSDFGKIKDNAEKMGLVLLASQSEKERSRIFYALADFLLARNFNVVTLENSPALVIPGINQIDVTGEKNHDHDSMLLSISKFDCDVLMIDQLLTKETADKVLSLFADKIIIASFEAKDSFDALSKITDLGVNPKVLADKLNLIISAYPVYRVCQSCKTLEKPDSKTIHQIRDILSGLPAQERSRLRKLGNHFYRGLGCTECNKTGYFGKITLYETFILNEKIRGLIIKNSDAEAIKKEAVRGGFTNLIQDGIIKALIGETTIREVLEQN